MRHLASTLISFGLAFGFLVATAQAAGAQEPKKPAAMSENERHELFQAAAIAGEEGIILKVCRALGLLDDKDLPTKQYQPFIDAHQPWAGRNVQFILDHQTKEKARAYLVKVGYAPPSGPVADPAKEAPASTGTPPKPQKEHEWLKQLVGEWECEGEAFMEPGKPPIKIRGTESSRMIGGFWATFEHKGEFMGAPFTGLMTLGYDPEKKRYVGTWVDSMNSHLWHYQGTLDAAGKVLTLESEGPSHEPGKLAKFKESIEIKGPDEKFFVSRIEKDGKWATMMTMVSRRKK